MRVILNSDILYHPQFVTSRLSTRLQTFLTKCAESRHIIVIPSTALLEFQRQQTVLAEQVSREIEDAYTLLDRYEISYTRVEPPTRLPHPDLIGLISALGAEVEVEQPTVADYEEAHRRACLHLAPQPPDSKNDEMRDLIIWMVALRVTERDAGALLVSRDGVHTHHLGDAEARAASLGRVDSLEEALEYLDVETPTTGVFSQLLTAVWPELVAAGLPLSLEPSILTVTRTSFIQGAQGPAEARCMMTARTQDGKTFRASVVIRSADGAMTGASFSDISVDGKLTQPHERAVAPTRKIATGWDAYGDRLAALREVIGGDR
jgi:hypothetical protein